ncbi:hypothetical protein [Alishewanella phage vB_AspM_Slicko01]|nr:hypothetical protein [Alishewanella phage vB_AspM_Slicko01]
MTVGVKTEVLWGQTVLDKDRISPFYFGDKRDPIIPTVTIEYTRGVIVSGLYPFFYKESVGVSAAVSNIDTTNALIFTETGDIGVMLTNISLTAPVLSYDYAETDDVFMNVALNDIFLGEIATNVNMTRENVTLGAALTFIELNEIVLPYNNYAPETTNINVSLVDITLN